ncbi:helix-turn-helix domain-containing protein [Qipengyuania atrilutea]|uniref:Helix-turn-helix domain-containing protein n=1 Tax=Qipengyuania atrilutea TaxID=2744473 RepID=A0A850H3D1_9SPHN|nr:helix-turn-helix domain-containing protein [Actirhodobacter atriluteus]
MNSEQQHEHLKWLLQVQGTSLSQIARSLDVRPTAVTMVSKGRGRSRRIEAAIAEAAGLTPAQLWPQHYAHLEETQMSA